MALEFFLKMLPTNTDKNIDINTGKNTDTDMGRRISVHGSGLRF